MEPLWLKAVVWAMSERPEITTVYGARLIDNPSRLWADSTSTVPGIQFEPFDRSTLERGNFIDMGTIAHRANPTVRFDEGLRNFGDWDLALQLTADHPPPRTPGHRHALHHARGRPPLRARRHLTISCQPKLKRTWSATSTGEQQSRVQATVAQFPTLQRIRTPVPRPVRR